MYYFYCELRPQRNWQQKDILSLRRQNRIIETLRVLQIPVGPTRLWSKSCISLYSEKTLEYLNVLADEYGKSSCMRFIFLRCSFGNLTFTRVAFQYGVLKIYFSPLVFTQSISQAQQNIYVLRGKVSPGSIFVTMSKSSQFIIATYSLFLIAICSHQTG